MPRWLLRQYRRLFPLPLLDSGVIPTSVTLDYRADRWDLERIVLDAVSNHLPDDTGGSRVLIAWKDGDRWRDDPLPARNSVDGVRVSDDGPGYDVGLLGLLHSTKSAGRAVGQFGEGLKLLSAACLREGYAVEFRSRDWIAQPRVEAVRVDGERIDRLCFAVERAPPIDGSRTTFLSPDSRLLDEFRSLPEKMLHFADGQDVLYGGRDVCTHGGPGSRIIMPKGGPSLYVRGVLVRNAIGGSGGVPAVFSYDLDTRDISPDRQLVDTNTARRLIGKLLLACDNTQVLDRVFKAAECRQFRIEFDALLGAAPSIPYSSDGGPQDRWRGAFEKLYGTESFMESGDYEADEDARRMGYRVVRLHDSVMQFLRYCCVPTAQDLSLRTRHEWMDPKDLTENEKRIFADVARLHEYYDLGSPPSVRIFLRCSYVRSDRHGREVVAVVEPLQGSYVTWLDGSHEVLIARQVLSDRRELVQTYLHEIVHHRTGARDYTREYAEGVLRILTEKYIADRVIDRA